MWDKYEDAMFEASTSRERAFELNESVERIGISIEEAMTMLDKGNHWVEKM